MDSGIPLRGFHSVPRRAGAYPYIRQRSLGGKASEPAECAPWRVSQGYTNRDAAFIRDGPNRRNDRRLGIRSNPRVTRWWIVALFVLVLAAILVVAAIRGTQGDLFTALGQDVPAFVVWGAAILAVGVLGYIKPLKPISQGLLVLLLVVLFMNNYKAILAGVTGAAQPGAGVTVPAQAGTTDQTTTAHNTSPSNPLASVIQPLQDFADLGVAAGS